jgi:hypothetical protein
MLYRYFVDVIELPSTFEQLRTTAAGAPLRILVDHLAATCTNPAIVNALLYVLIRKKHFTAICSLSTSLSCCIITLLWYLSVPADDMLSGEPITYLLRPSSI